MLFFVADQPFITYEIINRIIKDFKDNKSNIVILLYKGKKGNLVIFSSSYRDKFKKLKGDEGGKKLIKNERRISYIKIKDRLTGFDIDTLKDYEAFIKGDKNGV